MSYLFWMASAVPRNALKNIPNASLGAGAGTSFSERHSSVNSKLDSGHASCKSVTNFRSTHLSKSAGSSLSCIPRASSSLPSVPNPKGLRRSKGGAAESFPWGEGKAPISPFLLLLRPTKVSK